MHGASPALFRRHRLQRATVAVMSLLLVSAVAAVDLITGHELSLSILYLLPIALVTWYSWFWAAMFMCALSTVLWYAVERLTGVDYSHHLIPVWNAGVRLGFFLITMLLLRRLRQTVHIQKALAATDGLTGLLNGAAFRERAQAVLNLAQRHSHPLVLAFIDIDNFKVANDTLGHAEGDRILKAVAVTLMRCVRASDLAARIGGDEFAVLLPETDGDGARDMFNRIRARLLKRAAKSGWPVGFSIGVAVFQEPPADVTAALDAADRLMYKVKHGGKNAVCYDV